MPKVMNRQDIEDLCARCDAELDLIDIPHVRADTALLIGVIRGSLLRPETPFELATIGGLVEIPAACAPDESNPPELPEVSTSAQHSS